MWSYNQHNERVIKYAEPSLAESLIWFHEVFTSFDDIKFGYSQVFIAQTKRLPKQLTKSNSSSKESEIKIIINIKLLEF